LDAQREACEAYIKSQAHDGWRLIPGRYDDGAFSGASLDRPALQQLLADVRAGKIDIVLVYKVDRLTRSLADFANLIDLFDAHGVSFVSVTQSFNTSSSMGRLTLNVLLSFAQFERELIGERVRDKIAASKRKGIWVGGPVPLGYAAVDKKIVVVPAEVRRFARSLRAISSLAPSARWRRVSIGGGIARQPGAGPNGRPTARGAGGGGARARPSAQEPLLYRRGGLPWRGPWRRTGADCGSCPVRGGAGQACGPGARAALPAAGLARAPERAPFLHSRPPHEPKPRPQGPAPVTAITAPRRAAE